MRQDTSLWQITAIIGGTFVSEDLTVITSGLMLRQGRIGFWTALFGCFLGIFLGDLALYFLGFALMHLPGFLLKNNWFTRYHDRLEHRLPRIRQRMEREGWKLLLLSRFVPGSRFFVYTAAGALGGSFWKMALIVLVAGIIWTPFLLGLSWFLGNQLLQWFAIFEESGWLMIILIVPVFYGLHYLLPAVFTRQGRQRLIQSVRRLGHIEFWPAWLFYLPLPFMVAWHALRVRSLTVFTAVNPGMEDGGFIGESKSSILQHLPKRVTPAWRLIPGADASRDGLEKARRQCRWEFPLIFKPDVSQKGIGLKLVRDEVQFQAWLQDPDRMDCDWIMQQYAPGPLEVGIFYYRFAHENSGRIWSITNKVFPSITGDGINTIARLIQTHPRYRLQSSVFETRLKGRWHSVPEAGEKISLGIAGNHFQGALFQQANQWITPELNRAIEKISRQVHASMHGFYFGRYDIRCPSAEALMQGRHLSLIELNGATAESTDMYDPQLPLRSVYRIMNRHLDLLFSIGAANYKAGAAKSSLGQLLRALWRYHQNRPENLVSD
ncbi:MAG: VTT domain-containing protein [Leptospiraceae bacterium]|nr:VTT domain-containing protein [Leptospiraceae bacterium]